MTVEQPPSAPPAAGPHQPPGADRRGRPRVGVLGDGQLARMTAPAATALGVELRLLAGSWLSSAAQVIPRTTVGDYRSVEDVTAFAREVDVVTFDHEHVPAEVLAALEAAGTEMHPRPSALRYAQNKLTMRAAVEDLDLPNPQWREVTTAEELTEFGDGVGWPVVLKTSRGGYDGKGVRVIGSAEQVDEAEDWFARATREGVGLLAEEEVPFTRELSAQVARSADGEMRSYPVVRSDQTDGVCDVVTAPAAPDAPDAPEAHSDQDLLDRAAEIARTLAERLDVTGMLAVELFEVSEGERRGVFVNELAMRPHNSGHWTIDGAVTGQFEQHLRAVLGLPLGDTAPVAGPRSTTVMKNVFGGDEARPHTQLAAAMRTAPQAKVHLYGKEARPGRKIGHISIVVHDGDDHETVEEARRLAAEVAHQLSEGRPLRAPTTEETADD
ncbi:MAG: 5-(carboxyamino)imidazole ribonucleotide synthase [Nesterenkonia sp.]|nr:5-(carboxyamino)imidazole ribonucleotide synthase [Nesterenkonia sp.]